MKGFVRALVQMTKPWWNRKNLASEKLKMRNENWKMSYGKCFALTLFIVTAHAAYWILPQALVFQLSIASGGKIHGGSGIINQSERAAT